MSIMNPMSVLRRRKKQICCQCMQLFCKSCCDNLYYAEGYRDQKVPVCDKCYESELKIKSKKINEAYKDSVFMADFGPKQL